MWAVLSAEERQKVAMLQKAGKRFEQAVRQVWDEKQERILRRVRP